MMFEKYDAYKDSGVEWLGKIPANWSCIKMKFLYSDVSIKGRENAELLSVTQDRGVIPRAWVKNRMVMPSGNLESFKYIQKGDFAISLRSFEGGLEYCYHDGIISPAYTVLKKKRDYLTEGYYKYLFKSKIFISELQTSIVGIREGKNISYEELRYSYLPIPSVTEQNKISCFLDQKTSEIDQAIAIKEQQIGLLNERKQIVIQKAVTQGLDPNVPMKESGVEWIGEIPEHWGCKKFKFAMSIKARLGWKGLKADEYVDNSEYGFLSTPNIKHQDIKYDECYFITQRRYEESPEIMLENGDVLLVKDGSTLGISNIVKNLPFKCTVNSSIAVLRKFNKEQYLPCFLNYYLKTSSIQNHIKLVKDGMGVPHLFQSDIKNFVLITPPIQEQQIIIEYVESEIGKIGLGISSIQEQIEKLKEYKTTLINDAVTGKIKVA